MSIVRLEPVTGCGEFAAQAAKLDRKTVRGTVLKQPSFIEPWWEQQERKIILFHPKSAAEKSNLIPKFLG